MITEIASIEERSIFLKAIKIVMHNMEISYSKLELKRDAYSSMIF